MKADYTPLYKLKVSPGVPALESTDFHFDDTPLEVESADKPLHINLTRVAYKITLFIHVYNQTNKPSCKTIMNGHT